MRLRGCWLGVLGFRVWGCEASGLLGRVSGFFRGIPPCGVFCGVDEAGEDVNKNCLLISANTGVWRLWLSRNEVCSP